MDMTTESTNKTCTDMDKINLVLSGQSYIHST